MKKGSGTEALVQDHTLPDYGLTYRVYDTKGKPVAKVSSDLSEILKNATGGDIDRVFNQKNYSIAKVGFQKGTVTGTLFSGRTSAGDTLYGVAVNQKATVNPYISYNNGLSISKMKGDRERVEIDRDNLYFLTSMEVRTPSLKHKAGETNAFAALDGGLLLSNNRERKKETGVVTESKKQFDGDMDLSAGLENKYVSPDKKTKVDTKIYASFYPDYKNIGSADKTGLALNQVAVITGVEKEISNDTKALIDTAVILRKYGTSLAVKAMLKDEKRKITYKVGASTPVSKGTPSFLPGGEKRILLGVEKETDKMNFVIEFERLSNKSKRISAMGERKF
jgi:hypothetical protein